MASDPAKLISDDSSSDTEDIDIENYRIYSINRPGRLLKFLDLESGRLFEVGAYSRVGAY